jgi:hypothetical protein
MGTASGLFRTAQYLGAIAASTLIALCFRAPRQLSGPAQPRRDPGGDHVLLLVVTVFDRRLKDTPVNPEQKSEAQDDDRDPQCAHR